jgi:hypothetical protein
LTSGLPDPSAIQKQKDDHVRTLDETLRQDAGRIDAALKQQRESMEQAAEEQKRLFIEQVDNQIKMQEMDLDQQFLQVLQHVKQQATRQRAQLEKQAMELSWDYAEKKVEEDMLSHQFELAKNQQALKREMMNTVTAVKSLPSYLPPTSSTVMGISQVSSNPFAQEALRCNAQDSLTPPIVHAPLGMRTSTVAGVGPTQVSSTLAYNQTAARVSAALPTTVSAMPSLATTVAGPLPMYGSASWSPVPVAQPITQMVQGAVSYVPTMA